MVASQGTQLTLEEFNQSINIVRKNLTDQKTRECLSKSLARISEDKLKGEYSIDFILNAKNFNMIKDRLIENSKVGLVYKDDYYLLPFNNKGGNTVEEHKKWQAWVQITRAMSNGYVTDIIPKVVYNGDATKWDNDLEMHTITARNMNSARKYEDIQFAFATVYLADGRKWQVDMTKKEIEFERLRSSGQLKKDGNGKTIKGKYEEKAVGVWASDSADMVKRTIARKAAKLCKTYKTNQDINWDKLDMENKQILEVNGKVISKYENEEINKDIVNNTDNVVDTNLSSTKIIQNFVEEYKIDQEIIQDLYDRTNGNIAEMIAALENETEGNAKNE